MTAFRYWSSTPFRQARSQSAAKAAGIKTMPPSAGRKKLRMRSIVLEHAVLPARSFPTARVMHRHATKGHAIWRGTFTTRGQGTTVSFSKIQSVIDAAVESNGPAIPGSRTDEYSAAEPLGPIIAIRSTVVGWNPVVSAGTNRRRPDPHHDARRAAERLNTWGGNGLVSERTTRNFLPRTLIS
jgi:hypothetical protein